MDGDIITSSNCVRQPFSRHEIGLLKAVVLISRINLFYSLRWRAAPEYLTERTRVDRVDIVVGCVDTRRARQMIAAWCTDGPGDRTVYWLDLGNTANAGQFVLGQPLNAVNRRKADRLRTAVELFPEIACSTLDDDDGPGCSALESLERQEPFLNPALGNHALALLARLFRDGSLAYHGAFVNLATCRVQPIAIDPRVWRALRGRTRRSGADDRGVIHGFTDAAPEFLQPCSGIPAVHDAPDET